MSIKTHIKQYSVINFHSIQRDLFKKYKIDNKYMHDMMYFDDSADYIQFMVNDILIDPLYLNENSIYSLNKSNFTYIPQEIFTLIFSNKLSLTKKNVEICKISPRTWVKAFNKVAKDQNKESYILRKCIYSSLVICELQLKDFYKKQNYYWNTKV